MGVSLDGWVTPDTQLHSYITNESCMLDILILRKEEPEIRIPLCKMQVCIFQLSLVMYAHFLQKAMHHEATRLWYQQVFCCNDLI